jgi:hypothetical protein
MKTRVHFSLAFWAILPLFVACTHAPLEVSDNELLEEINEPAGPALTKPALTVAFATASEPSEKLVAAQQKKVRKLAPVKSPFASISKPAPDHAVTRNGERLNRYYFIRLGDTPESLSIGFYGTAERAQDLVQWNGSSGIWKAGQTLYYSSQKNPADNRLLSFYSESNAPTEVQNVGAGQDLRQLAEKLYGAEGSWREIAILNGLTGSIVTRETSVRLLPSKLFASAEIPAVAAAETISKPTVGTVVRENKLAYSQIGAFVQHNPLLVACSFVVFSLVAFWLALQRRKYRSRFDF